MPLFILFWIFSVLHCSSGHYLRLRDVKVDEGRTTETSLYSTQLSPTGRRINEPCDIATQCNGTIGALCSPHGFCECPFKGIVSEELGKPRCFLPVRTLYDICEVDEQCRRAILNSHCSSAGVCTCYHGYMYFWSSGTCAMPPGPDTTKAQEVYKTAMAAAACTLIALVGIFVGCVVKKTFCSTNHHSSRHPLGRLTSLTESINSVNVALDKPPTYDEIMTSLTCVTPPPDYRDLQTIFGFRDPKYFVFPQALSHLAGSSILTSASPLPSPAAHSPTNQIQMFDFKVHHQTPCLLIKEEEVALSDPKVNNDKSTSTCDKDLALSSEVLPSSKESVVEASSDNVASVDAEKNMDQQVSQEELSQSPTNVPLSPESPSPSSDTSNKPDLSKPSVSNNCTTPSDDNVILKDVTNTNV